MGTILDDRKVFCNNSLAECKPAMFYDFLVDIKAEFSKRLREALQDKWPGERIQEYWAEQLDISPPTLSQWLNGIKMPGMEKFIEVCLTLDVCVEWLATGKGPKRPPCDHIKPASVLSDEQKLQLKKITELVCG